MLARPTLHRRLGGLVVAAVTGSALVMVGAPAQAETLANDTTFVPVAADVIGVGSDTTEISVKKVADAWNAQTPAPAARLATFQAFGGGTIPLPAGPVNRPNGSGAGKSTLYGTGNIPDVDFARSSSGFSANETAAGLQAFPFALDVLAMSVASSATNAPASLTPAQIVGIYKGDIKNWSDVGGKTGVIAPKIPQPGSGTRSFFDAQLRAMNSGTAVVLGTNVVEVQEHDDTPIKNDPNAIAPFSVGRAGLTNGTLTFLNQDTAAGGWSAKRVVYNFVRGTDVAKPEIQALFGEDGFFCSTAARDLITAGGLAQLATPANGGVCGQATGTNASNFTLNEQVLTSTSLTATSGAANAVTLTAAVTGASAPAGTVTFEENGVAVVGGSNVPLTSGQAVVTLTGVSAGAHTYTAEFTPAANTAFDPSASAPATVTVKSASTITVKAPKTAAPGKVKVTVTVPGGTGDVQVLRKGDVLKSGELVDGVAKLTLKLKEGTQKLVASFAGDSALAAASKKFTIKVG